MVCCTVRCIVARPRGMAQQLSRQKSRYLLVGSSESMLLA
jgi:hypothetical protein